MEGKVYWTGFKTRKCGLYNDALFLKYKEFRYTLVKIYVHIKL